MFTDTDTCDFKTIKFEEKKHNKLQNTEFLERPDYEFVYFYPCQGSQGLLIGSPRTPICGHRLLFVLEIYQKSLFGTATFSGIAFWDS